MVDRPRYPWGMNKKEYARGYHAEIFVVEPQCMPAGFSHADLMRVESHKDKKYGLKLFAQFKIVNALFPGHFPEVTAFSTDLRGSRFDIPLHYLFTKKVPVQDGHDVYCNDMGSWEGQKLIACQHRDCHEHDNLHVKYEGCAKDFRKALASAGIIVPHPIIDPSDWCVHNETGDIVYFEVEDLKPSLVRGYIVKHENPMLLQNAEKYLKVLEQI